MSRLTLFIFNMRIWNNVLKYFSLPSHDILKYLFLKMIFYHFKFYSTDVSKHPLHDFLAMHKKAIQKYSWTGTHINYFVSLDTWFKIRMSAVNISFVSCVGVYIWLCASLFYFRGWEAVWVEDFRLDFQRQDRDYPSLHLFYDTGTTVLTITVYFLNLK